MIQFLGESNLISYNRSWFCEIITIRIVEGRRRVDWFGGNLRQNSLSGRSANHDAELNFVNRLNSMVPAYTATNEKVLQYLIQIIDPALAWKIQLRTKSQTRVWCFWNRKITYLAINNRKLPIIYPALSVLTHSKESSRSGRQCRCPRETKILKTICCKNSKTMFSRERSKAWKKWLPGDLSFRFSLICLPATPSRYYQDQMNDKLIVIY